MTGDEPSQAAGAEAATRAGAGPGGADTSSGEDAGRAALALLRAIAVRLEAARRLDAGSGEALLHSIVEATVALFGATAASIALYEPESDSLVFRVAAGEQGAGVVGLSIAPDRGVAGYVFTSGQALALADVEQDRRFGRDVAERTRYLPRSMVGVPLVDEGGTIGVLEVLDRRDGSPFSLRDVELASVFARQAAVAIRASRVERDSASLLAATVRALGEGSVGDADVEALVAAATAGLDRTDDSRLWAMADQVARVRAADPDQLALVADILGVLADHAERARPRARRRSGPERRATP
jgi:GAF domain-containing protein